MNMRLTALLFTLLLAVSSAFSQTAADKLYNQGLQLQKTMTVAAQNSAISKFTSAKKQYDSAAKKAQCDQAISVSRNIISQIKSGGGSSGASSKKGKTVTKEVTVVERKVEAKLNVNPTDFDIDLNSKTLNVSVDTNLDNWNVATVTCADGSSFLRVNKLGADKFEIVVPQNNKTIIREQEVIVTSDNLERRVKVRQSGRPIDLSVNKAMLEYKKSGGDKKIDVLCNSDYSYADNNNYNWYVESKPDWVVITSDRKSEGGLLNKVKSSADKIINGEKNEDSTTQKFTMKITVKPFIPTEADAYQGRNGEVVLRSGDKTVKVIISHLGEIGKAK